MPRDVGDVAWVPDEATDMEHSEEECNAMRYTRKRAPRARWCSGDTTPRRKAGLRGLGTGSRIVLIILELADMGVDLTLVVDEVTLGVEAVALPETEKLPEAEARALELGDPDQLADCLGSIV